MPSTSFSEGVRALARRKAEEVSRAQEGTAAPEL